jgi:hypothetical protein
MSTITAKDGAEIYKDWGHVPASREEHRHDCCQPDRP